MPERNKPGQDPAHGEPETDPHEGDEGRDPHHALNNPVRDPDPTEWPDPYEKRPDPRGPQEDGEDRPGGPSTSEPHPPQSWERQHHRGEGSG
ncbi:MAG TPA: hypothetical protein VKA89_08795 [Solirubrobacterales bacterium]|nr:hypothetical protein [Solirubrobacterales bacterium]